MHVLPVTSTVIYGCVYMPSLVSCQHMWILCDGLKHRRDPSPPSRKPFLNRAPVIDTFCNMPLAQNSAAMPCFENQGLHHRPPTGVMCCSRELSVAASLELPSGQSLWKGSGQLIRSSSVCQNTLCCCCRGLWLFPRSCKILVHIGVTTEAGAAVLFSIPWKEEAAFHTVEEGCVIFNARFNTVLSWHVRSYPKCLCTEKALKNETIFKYRRL